MTSVNAEWFKSERGIEKQTLDAFGVRFEPKGVVFPYRNGEKTRFVDSQGRRRFIFTDGVAPCLFRAPDDPKGATVAFVCEGETDAMRLWQELGEDVSAQVFSVGGINTWRDEFAKELERYDHVFVVLDNEDEYDNPTAYKAVEQLWLKMHRVLRAKAKRIKLPDGTQDLCEFFDVYDIDTLRKLAERESQVKSYFKPLDLTIEPPPPDWLWEGVIAKGDFNLLSGLGGIGKSWLTMALSIAVADEHDTFLGLPMQSSGNVLYIDEENPVDVVFNRLNRLGLQNKNRVRYLWNNNIKVDRKGEAMLEEALNFNPELLVIDSLSRVHGKEENSKGEMSPLLDDILKPLARETGAALIVIHHHDKNATAPRGSTDIVNAPDATLDVYDTGVEGQIKLKVSKSRRRPRGEILTYRIVDLPDGGAQLQPQGYTQPPF